MKCPLGVYGNATNLNSLDCTAPCPLGTYNDEEGVSSIEDCKPCPPGTYGKDEGMITAKCSGTYSDRNRQGSNSIAFMKVRNLLKVNPTKVIRMSFLLLQNSFY